LKHSVINKKLFLQFTLVKKNLIQRMFSKKLLRYIKISKFIIFKINVFISSVYAFKGARSKIINKYNS